MVIGPKDLEKRIEEKDADKLTQAETAIDEALMNGRSTSHTVSSTFMHGLHPSSVKKLLDKYRQAGWEVNSINDQRDGNYLVFNPRSQFTSIDMREVGPYGSGRGRPYE